MVQEVHARMEDEQGDNRKRKLLVLIIIIIVLSIVIPITFLSLFIKEEGSSRYYFTYKEFHDQFESLDLKDGDTIIIKDFFSGIWYNETAHYTYMTFQSMDEYRTDSWGYDAGYPEDITDDYKVKDKVIIEVEINQKINDQGYPTLVGHIKSIEQTD